MILNEHRGPRKITGGFQASYHRGQEVRTSPKKAEANPQVS